MSVLELHKSLVTIDSTSNVDDIRQFIVDFLENHNEHPTVDKYGNVIATKGSGQPHYILNTHFDTVPPYIEYSKNEDVITGRGAADAKGPLAVFLQTFIDTTISDGRLTIALTPDEETAMKGAIGLQDEMLPENPTGFIIGEPTNLDICTSSKGYFEGEIRVTGISAHSSTPTDGCNAISVGAEIITKLDSFDEYTELKPHDELGVPILEPTLITGGEAINQIPESCTISFSRRGVPPETKEMFMTNLTQFITQDIPSEASVEVYSEFDGFLQPFDTDNNSALVHAFSNSGAGEIRAFTAATEASIFAKYNVPIVVFGPGHISDEDGAVAHSEREYVSANDVTDARTILQETLSRLFENSAHS